MDGRSRIAWVRRARQVAQELRSQAWLDSKVEVPLTDLEPAVFKDLSAGAAPMTRADAELFVLGPGTSRAERARYRHLCERWPSVNAVLDRLLT